MSSSGQLLAADGACNYVQESAIYTVIQQYSFDPRSRAILNRTMKEAFVPLLRAAPGFVAYYWLDSGDGSATSLCVFEDQTGAHAALDLAANFIRRQSLALVDHPNVIQGEVAVYANCGL